VEHLADSPLDEELSPGLFWPFTKLSLN